jgi:hypothetical protein
MVTWKSNEELPVLPHGWKTEIAAMIGVHRNSVTRALRYRTGTTYRRVVHAVREKYGK